MRTTRHGSGGLIRKTGPAPPSTAMSVVTVVAVKAGFRSRSRAGRTTWRMWLLLLQTNRWPQSSTAWPNWPPPEIASKAEPSGLNRKSRPRTETGLTTRLRGIHDVPAVGPRRPVDPAVVAPEQAVQQTLHILAV